MEKVSSLGVRICWRCKLSIAHSTRRQASSGRKSAAKKLPDRPCRTRFAPSPTGNLHLGSLRTALFSYLLARATKGHFLLRLEDTDRARTVPGSEQSLYDDLKWAGLKWDEGPDVGGPYGPYRQSERKDTYAEKVQHLLDTGKAYRCFCSPEELEAQQKLAHQDGKQAHYNGTCRHVSPEESAERAERGDAHAVRFKSSQRPVTYQDLVYNHYKKGVREDDFIIMKRDGYPTYHFANIVDDHLMDITHVIRGAEWLISTPKHIDLYQAFGWAPPQFAHVGLLVDKDRTKLSKRSPGISLSWYKENHFYPPAILNFAAMLGWSTTSTRKVMTLDEMVDNFTLKFTKGDIIVDLANLDYFQTQHLAHAMLNATSDPALQAMFESLVRPVQQKLQSMESSVTQHDPDTPLALEGIGPLFDYKIKSGVTEKSSSKNYVLRMFHAGLLPRRNNIEEYILRNKYLYFQPSEEVLVESLDTLLGDIRWFKWEGNTFPIAEIMDKFGQQFWARWDTGAEADDETSSWTEPKLRDRIQEAAGRITWDVTGESGEQQEYAWAGHQVLRWALTASTSGPSLHRIMYLLGRQETERRLKIAGSIMSQNYAGQGLESSAQSAGESASG